MKAGNYKMIGLCLIEQNEGFDLRKRKITQNVNAVHFMLLLIVPTMCEININAKKLFCYLFIRLEM